MARTAVLSLVLLLAAAAPGVTVAADTGSLLVTCWPGYAVFLDDEPVGVTVVEEDGRFLTGLASGRHTVRVEREGFLPFEAEVEVVAGAIAELKVPELEPAAATLTVCCEAGFRVYLDDVLVGLTGGEMGSFSTEVEPGAHGVRVEKLGRERYAETLEIPAGRTFQVVVGEGGRALATEGAEPAGRPLAAPPVPTAAPPASAPAASREEALAAVVAPEQTTPATTPAGADPFADLEGSVTPRVVSDVLFGYRARGAAIAAGGGVTVTRERGGPKSPVMVFWCKNEPQCGQRTGASFAPGDYRFRVSCRPPKAVAADAHDVFLDLAASSGHNYLVDVSWDGDGSAPCTAEIADVR